MTLRGLDGRLGRRAAAALRRYGTRVALKNAAGGNERSVWACIQPYTHRNREYLEERLTILGKSEPNSFLYIGEAAGGAGLAAPGDFVVDGTAQYIFSSCAALCSRGEAAYVWGVLKKTEGEGTWKASWSGW